jgi:deoxycytidylate deaminase
MGREKNNNNFRRMNNIIVGLAGPYGSGCSSSLEELQMLGEDWPGCHVVNISASKLIARWYSHITGKRLKVSEKSTSQRRKDLQKAGTKLRKIDNTLVGKLIVCEIFKRGIEIELKAVDEGSEKIDTIVFVVDSLKNTNEVNLLQDVYGDEFILAFIHSNKEARWRRMRDYKSWTDKQKKEFQSLDDIDSDEKSVNPKVKNFGQQVKKLAAIADYYFVNNSTRDDLKNDVYRFFCLIFGLGINQPTADESSMHLAFSAANSSACLSRQVGAAIFTPQRNVLSVGHNDVPKSGGSLYNVEDNKDYRCKNVGDRRCINDTNKEERFNALTETLCGELKIKDKDKINLVKNLVEKSEFKDATEYCRAIHSEMDALLSVSRNSSGSTIGCTMYVTTQPCHNCAKHIVCAGIKKVVYMEPYPKSLGEELHSDAIILDPLSEVTEENKVIFMQYQGIAPHRFHDIFSMQEERKDAIGRMLHVSKQECASKPRFSKNISTRSRDIKKESNPNTVSEVNILESFLESVKPGRKNGKKKRAKTTC